MEFLTALGKTVLLRSYVFALLTLALAISVSLMGRTRCSAPPSTSASSFSISR